MGKKKNSKTKNSKSSQYWNATTYLLVVVMSVVAGFAFNPPVVSKKILFRSLESAAGTTTIGDKVLVGTNSNIDLIVSATELFEALPGANPPKEAKNEEQLSNLNQLISTFVYFFDQGSAAERFVTDESLFSDLVNAARKLPSRIERAGGLQGVVGKGSEGRGVWSKN